MHIRYLHDLHGIAALAGVDGRLTYHHAAAAELIDPALGIGRGANDIDLLLIQILLTRHRRSRGLLSRSGIFLADIRTAAGRLASGRGRCGGGRAVAARRGRIRAFRRTALHHRRARRRAFTAAVATASGNAQQHKSSQHHCQYFTHNHSLLPPQYSHPILLCPHTIIYHPPPKLSSDFARITRNRRGFWAYGRGV